MGVNKKSQRDEYNKWMDSYIQQAHDTSSVLHYKTSALLVTSTEMSFFPENLVDLSKLKLCDQSESKQRSISGKSYSALKYLG